MTGAPLQVLGEAAGFPELLEEALREHPCEDFAPALEQARAQDYGNCFEAVPADVVWRAQPAGSDGRNHPRPTAPGAQSAIVVGPDGGDSARGADKLYCDRLGRVRIRFHWQDGQDADVATCWVRVAQRLAGGGIGSQFLPRIGQEVFVQFIENDIDRPIVVGALYNGQGEGGIAPTPRAPSARAVAGIAMLKQAVKLGDTFSKAAVTHQTVGLAAHLGAAKADASLLDDKAAPLKATLDAVSGMVGLDVTAADAVQLSNGETITLMSGQDTQFVTDGAMRVHSGQAIDILAGAVKPGEGGTGLH